MQTLFYPLKGFSAALHDAQNDVIRLEFGETRCKCGFSPCIILVNADEDVIRKFVMCDVCYHDASYFEKGL